MSSGQDSIQNLQRAPAPSYEIRRANLISIRDLCIYGLFSHGVGLTVSNKTICHGPAEHVRVHAVAQRSGTWDGVTLVEIMGYMKVSLYDQILRAFVRIQAWGCPFLRLHTIVLTMSGR